MSIKICIPTYSRNEIKTVKLLSMFDSKDVYIFPNNYRENLPEEVSKLKEKYPTCQVIGLNTFGIPSARNAILDFFPENDEILMLDDDISEILRLKTDPAKLKNTLAELSTLEIKDFFTEAFDTLKKNNAHLWGVYPIDNPFYMKNKLNNKGFIIGTMFGVIKTELRFDEKLKLKEDYDFTLQHILRDKKVCRFDGYTIKAEHYNNDGGCVSQRKENTNLEKECCNYILAKHPRFIKRNSKRDNEILINL